MAGHKVEIVPYTESMGRQVAANLRRDDRREIYYLSLLDPWSAMHLSATRSIGAWVGLVDGEPVTAFGCARQYTMSHVVAPWLLATDVIERVPMIFLRQSRVYFDRMCEAFPLMENDVLADNVKAVAWLRWLGFEMEAPRPRGPFGASFIRFGKGLAQCA